MKELTGSASGTTPASPEACMALLSAADRYPDWYPDVVKEVEVLERDDQGRATKVRTKLHVQHGPITRDFDLVMSVSIDPSGTIKLSRIPHDGRDGERFDVTWRVEPASSSRIQLNLVADLDVPRFLPLGDIGDSIAAGFISAATKALG